MSDFEGQAAVDAADDETSVGTAVAMDDDYTKPRGWRHGATWTYLIMLLASAVALLVSFILSADTLKMARNPGQKLNCDVNAVLSCSTVAESWQAEIVKFAGLSFPNAFFGIAAESVFVTIAVIGLSKVAVPRWFALCTWLGGLAAFRREGLRQLVDFFLLLIRQGNIDIVIPGNGVDNLFFRRSELDGFFIVHQGGYFRRVRIFLM